MKSLLSKSIYKPASWQEYASAYFSNTEDDKKKSRIAMLLAMFGNMWEANRAYKVEQEVEDLEASGALKKAKYVQNAKDKSELLEIDKGIQSSSQYVYFDAPAEASFNLTNESVLNRLDTSHPEYNPTYLKEKQRIKREWIDKGPYAQHKQRMEAWDMDTDIGFVTNANGTVIGQNLVEPKSLPKGHTWTRVEKMRNVPTEVYTNSANDLLRYEKRIAQDPRNLSWAHAAYGWATGDKGDPTLKEKIALEDQRFLARSARSAEFTDVGETGAVMASLSIDDINDTVITGEEFRYAAKQTLTDYPSLIPKAVEKFDSYLYHAFGDDGKPVTKDIELFSTIGNAKAVLSSLLDNAQYETKKGDIEIQRRVVADHGIKNGWSSERIELQQDRTVANALGISTAVLDKRLELTELLDLAKEIGYKEIAGKKADLEYDNMHQMFRQSFGDTTAERLAESITGQAIINYVRDLSTGELDVAITSHLGNLGQQVGGDFIHRDPIMWMGDPVDKTKLGRPGVSATIYQEIVDAEFDIGDLTEGTAAYTALFNYKEENYREILTQINSKAAVFAGSELSKELDKILFKTPEEEE